MRSPPPRLSLFGACRIAKAISRQTTQQETHQADERVFWAKQLSVSRGLNWITGIGSVVGIIGLVFVGASFLIAKQAANDATATAEAAKEQAKAAMEANRITMKNFIGAQRPWISIDVPTLRTPLTPLTPDVHNGVPVTLLMEFNNFGHTPAQNVEAYFEVLPGMGCHSDNECLGIQERVCKVATNGSYGLTIFPGEHPKPQFQEMQFISNEAIAEATAKMPPNFKVLWPHIFLCVAYHIAGTEDIGLTPYAFEVDRKNGQPILATDNVIPLEDLIVRSNLLGSVMNAR